MTIFEQIVCVVVAFNRTSTSTAQQQQQQANAGTSSLHPISPTVPIVHDSHFTFSPFANAIQTFVSFENGGVGGSGDGDAIANPNGDNNNEMSITRHAVPVLVSNSRMNNPASMNLANVDESGDQQAIGETRLPVSIRARIISANTQENGAAGSSTQSIFNNLTSVLSYTFDLREQIQNSSGLRLPGSLVNITFQVR